MKIGICWFRKALRLHDNNSLLRACAECDIVYPIFFLDPAFTTTQINQNAMRGTGVSLPSKNVFKFFFETLGDLQQSLASKKYNSNLLILRGNPTQLFPKILSNLKITDLYFEIDTEPYAKQRDAQIVELCNRLKVRVNSDYGHTLYPMDQLIACADSMNKRLPTTYKAFCNMLTKIGSPAKPKDPPTAIPGNNAISELIQNPQFRKEMTAISKMQQFGFAVPTVDELEYKTSENVKVNAYEIEQQNITQSFKGGESNAFTTMRAFLKEKEKVCKFEKPKTSPNALTAQTTTLSMYLTNGSLSVRLLWHEINKIYVASKQYTKPPTSLHGQLYFREFFYLCSHVTPNYAQMKNNKMCKQIEWNEYDEAVVNKWKYGQTGYPFIDALMIQLRRTGWMHHLGRHAVACFLTRGDLWQSWEVGMKVFSKYLLDGDYALNASNWMWLSASAFFTAYFRVYSPVSFGKKTDKNGDFIKHWIPQLKHYPKKYIYEPWTAPKELQKQCGCVIGKDYPMPMVDHKKVSKENMDRMKVAYQKNRDSKKRKLDQMDVDVPAAKKRKIARK